MAKLPTRDDLGPLPSGRSGRTVATFDTSAVGQSAARFGQTIAGVGQDFFEREQKLQRTKASTGLQKLNQKGPVILDQEYQNITPTGEGFTNAAGKAFDGPFQAYIKSLPPYLKEEFTARAEVIRDRNAFQAAKLERDQGYKFAGDGVTESLDEIQILIDQNPDDYERLHRLGLESINEKGAILPPEVQRERREAWEEAAIATHEMAKVRSDPQYARRYSSLPQDTDARSIIRAEEDFSPSTYFDKTAHRLGYGTDTITKADGTVHSVNEGDVVSREDAERDLARRVIEFEGRASGQVGAETWANIPPHARGALVSVTYNYGSLPKSVVQAIKLGDIEDIAEAVEKLKANPERRAREAAIIRGRMPVPDKDIPKGLPFDSYSAIRNQANKTIKAEYDESFEGLLFNIADGNAGLGEIDQFRRNFDMSFADYDKAVGELEDWTDKRADLAAAESLKSAIMAGKGTVNPHDPRHVKVGETLYKQVIEEAPEELRPQAEADFINQTKYIPKSVRQDIRGGVMSNDPQMLLPALDKANVMKLSAPGHYRTFEGGGDVRTAVDVYNAALRIGFTPEEAAKQIIDSRQEGFSDTRKALLESKQAKKWLDNKATANQIGDQFDNFLNINPRIGHTDKEQFEIVSEYRTILEQSLLDTAGNRDLALELANERFSRIYGVSDMSLGGTKTLTRLPPESTYAGHLPENITMDDLKDQLRDDIIAEGFSEGVQDVFLQSTPLTDADYNAGRPPHYDVYFIDENRSFSLTVTFFESGLAS